MYWFYYDFLNFFLSVKPVQTFELIFTISVLPREIIETNSRYLISTRRMRNYRPVNVIPSSKFLSGSDFRLLCVLCGTRGASGHHKSSAIVNEQKKVWSDLTFPWTNHHNLWRRVARKKKSTAVVADKRWSFISCSIYRDGSASSTSFG